ncbi:phospholipase [Chitinophaga barathri]|uniref:Phospholipase n=2 Tax=Chitinophaga barathri TaxID=1647451 RepID=A0A3N4MUB9_9BACT|nr:phospholipase [Chitinophaga barathri]
MAACSKTSTVDPAKADPQAPGAEQAPANEQAAAAFTPQQTGVSFKKVNNPKLVTDYVLQIPASYNTEKTKRWPVIIFLHGIGERGNTTNDLNMVKRAGLAGVAAKNPNFPYIVISPQCKTNSWWHVPSLNALYDDIVKQYNVDPKRIYVTGLSMGGFGCWEWVAAYPTRFAAAAPICGAGPVAKACALKDKPVWAFHNADDPQVNVSGSRNMVNAIKSCGGQKVKYTENPTGGHDAWTKAYNDQALFTWLNAQRLP